MSRMQIVLTCLRTIHWPVHKDYWCTFCILVDFVMAIDSSKEGKWDWYLPSFSIDQSVQELLESKCTSLSLIISIISCLTFLSTAPSSLGSQTSIHTALFNNNAKTCLELPSCRFGFVSNRVVSNDCLK